MSAHIKRACLLLMLLPLLGYGAITVPPGLHKTSPIHSIEKKVPDLQISSVRVMPRPKAARKIKTPGALKIKIRNGGSSDISVFDLDVSCSIRNSSEKKCPVGLNGKIRSTRLGAGKSVKIAWPKHSNDVWVAGDYTLNITADVHNRIKESNEKNNKKIFRFTIKPNNDVTVPGIAAPPQLQDLSVDFVRFGTLPKAGEKVGATHSKRLEIHVRNRAKAETPRTKLSIICRPKQEMNHCPKGITGRIDIPSLKAGEVKNVLWPKQQSSTWSAGTYTVYTMVDPDKKIDERDKRNNQKQYTFTIAKKKKNVPSKKKLIVSTKPNVLSGAVLFKSLTPSKWAKGKSYKIWIRGGNFDKNIELRFSPGVKIDNYKVVNSKLITANITIDKGAKKAKATLLYKIGRKLHTLQQTNTISQLATGAGFKVSSLYGWVERGFHIGKIPKFSMPSLTESIDFLKGKITLETPKIHTEGMENDAEDYYVPKVTDQTIFSWREENPGVAEWFEFRISNKSGKVLWRKDIKRTSIKLDKGDEKGVEGTAFYSSPAFVYKLNQLYEQSRNIVLPVNTLGNNSKSIPKSTAQKHITLQQKTVSSKNIKAQNSTHKSPAPPTISSIDGINVQADFYWNVIGKRRYNKAPAIKPSSSKYKRNIKYKTKETVDIVVEESEKWPLRIGYFKSGLACSQTNNIGHIDLQNIDREGEKKGEVNPVNYPGHRFELTAETLNLANIPWNIAFDTVHVKGQSGILGAAQDHDEETGQSINFYVSWGDGIVERLTLQGLAAKSLSESGHGNVGEIAFTSIDGSFSKMEHRYQFPGVMHVKVFALPESDIQQVDVGGVVTAFNIFGKNRTASLVTQANFAGTYGNNPYYRTLGLNHSLPQVNPKMTEIAKHAYMIYCNTLTIEPVKDLVASGPLHLESIAITGYNDKKTGQGISNIVPSLNECDMMTAEGALKYYGKGRAAIHWVLREKGGTAMELPTPSNPKYLSSKSRDGLTIENNKQARSDSYDYAAIYSAKIDMEQLTSTHRYVLGVDVTVNTSDSMALSSNEILQEITAAITGINDTPRLASATLSPQMMYLAMNTKKVLNPYLNMIVSRGVKLGVLSPAKHANGLPMVADLSSTVKSVTALMNKPKIVKIKPYYVASDPFAFTIHPKQEGQICRMRIETKSKDIFWINNVADTVKEVSPGVYSGSGDLYIKLNNGTNTEVPVNVSIDKWQLGKDGLTVKKGHIKTTIDSKNLTGAGVDVSLKKLEWSGRQDNMHLTLDAAMQDKTLRLPGSTQSVKWQNISSRLDGEGNWYYADSTARRFTIGWSGFEVISSTMVIDFSAKIGKGISGECSDRSAAKWVGIHMGSATLLPNLLDFSKQNYHQEVDDWGIRPSGLCGSAHFGKYSTQFKKGTLDFDSLDVNIDQGKFDATYRSMDVYVPWLDTHFRGDARLQDSPGEDSVISFLNLHPETKSIEKKMGPVSLVISDLTFGSYKGVGWGAISDNTLFTFKTEGNIVTDNALFHDLVFAMDGRVYQREKKADATTALGGKAIFGKTPVDLVSADLTLHEKGDTLMDFRVNTNFSISEEMETVPVPVGYAVKTAYSTGPTVKPFIVNMAFPSGQPNVESKVTVNYTGASSAKQAYMVPYIDTFPALAGNAYRSDIPLIADLGSSGKRLAGYGAVYLADNSGASANDKYNGTIDMAMFGGPPVKAEFRLGYLNGHDYWLMRSTLSLGTSGTPFVPPLLNLYAIRGGLGHNFPVDAFKHAGSISDVYPKINGSLLFMAGLRVGSPDKFTAVFDGDLSIQLGHAARMDFRAWLLQANQPGDGNFQGWFQYGSGSFDGALEGGMDFLSGMVKFVIPHDAMTMHFGNGDWYIYAGKKEGPRIKMYVLIAEQNGYFMLDSNALAVGSGMSFYLNAGIGHISGSLETGIEIAYPPHIAGYGEGAMEAKVCCCHVCIGPTANVGVNVAALPLNIGAHACFSFDLGITTVGKCDDFSL